MTSTSIGMPAFTLWETGVVKPNETVRFSTLSGWLSCRRVDDWIEMDFPAKVCEPCAAPAGVAAPMTQPCLEGLARRGGELGGATHGDLVRLRLSLDRLREELAEAAIRIEIAPDHDRVVRFDRLGDPIDERPWEPQRVAHFPYGRP